MKSLLFLLKPHADWRTNYFNIYLGTSMGSCCFPPVMALSFRSLELVTSKRSRMDLLFLIRVEGTYQGLTQHWQNFSSKFLVRQVWRLPWKRMLEGSLVVPAWCGGSRGPRLVHEAGDSLPVWLATRSRLITWYTGTAATGVRLLDLHRSFSHQTSHTTQPPRGGATATTACVAARAAMPNNEEGSVVCCVPSCHES